MKTLIQRPTSPPIEIAVSQEPEGLGAIYNITCAAAIWKRAPLPSFQRWIDQLPVEMLPTARLTLQPGSVRRAMFELCCSFGLADTEERAMLVDDIAALADFFADLTQATYLKCRLDVVSNGSRQTFHQPDVTTRLICTYRGAGTEYGFAQHSKFPRTIRRVATGSAIVLRGTHWPTAPGSCLVHRTPLAEGTDRQRLVLTLDPVTELGGGNYSK